MTDLSDGDVVDGSKKLNYAPLDENDNAITGARANITLTIKEPGETAITKTNTDLTEDPSGTYYFWHKITKAGTTYGDWLYDGASNQDGVDEFKYYAGPRRSQE